jgi:hypothetical protein
MSQYEAKSDEMGRYHNYIVKFESLKSDMEKMPDEVDCYFCYVYYF